MRARKDEAPKLSIGPVLIHYGANSLPGGVGWQSMRCPFPEHNDSNASARVNLDAGGFVCLACGISGDAIKIIRNREGLSFGQAIDYAREVFGASVEAIPRSANGSKPANKFGRNKWKAILDESRGGYD